MQPGGEDFLRELTEFMLYRIMKADITLLINAERHECSNERETYRNVCHDRQYNTRSGALELRIPKLREGSYFPSLDEAEADVPGYFSFPKAHRVKLHSTNIPERLNKEVTARRRGGHLPHNPISGCCTDGAERGMAAAEPLSATTHYDGDRPGR